MPESQKKAPDYYNPHNITQEIGQNSNPLLALEPLPQNPQEMLKKKYPIKIIAGFAVLLIMVLATGIGVYLSQRPTRVFIEATATPTATPTPTPTPTPTAINTQKVSY